jgi:DNA invertase Pin-like site-specific DNA recombinase
MATPTRACAYYRFSDDRQENSISRQRSQVEPYAAKNGYIIVKTYSDEGIPGDEEKRRKGFMQMMADAQQGRFAVILCDDRDRLGRWDSITSGYYVYQLRSAGVRLETVAQGRIKWDDFASRIVDAVLAESKKLESQATSRRVITQMLQMARRPHPLRPARGEGSRLRQAAGGRGPRQGAGRAPHLPPLCREGIQPRHGSQ